MELFNFHLFLAFRINIILLYIMQFCMNPSCIEDIKILSFKGVFPVQCQSDLLKVSHHRIKSPLASMLNSFTLTAYIRILKAYLTVNIIYIC